MDWADLIAALGLVFVVEGALYALFPDGARAMLVTALSRPSAQIRILGLGAMIAGLVIVYAVRG